MKLNLSKLIILLVFQAYFLSPASGQIEKSNTGIDFPCAPDVKLKEFQDKQAELNNLPPPIPPAVPPEFKEWQVVVDREFDYRATPKSKGENWQWSVGDGSGNNFWNFVPSLNGTNKGVSKIIPNASLPTNNDFFGSTKGQLLVSAEVGEDDNNNPIVSSDQKEIKIFYKKDDMNYHDSSVPNWFYYWSKAVSGQLTTSGIKVFNVNPNGTGATLQADDPTPITFSLVYRDDGNYFYPQPVGATQLFAENNLGNQMGLFQFFYLDDNGACNGYRKLLTGYPSSLSDHAVINIGKGCGYNWKIYDFGPGPLAYNGPLPPPHNVARGIDCFYALLNHEIVHWSLYEEFWSQSGYDSANDCDFDFYPDDWELGPIGMSYGFIVGVEDKYTHLYDPENLQGVMPLSSRAATWFHEEKCRRKENSTQLNSPHSIDWSFDPTYENQGKQW